MISNYIRITYPNMNNETYSCVKNCLCAIEKYNLYDWIRKIEVNNSTNDPVYNVLNVELSSDEHSAYTFLNTIKLTKDIILKHNIKTCK